MQIKFLCIFFKIKITNKICNFGWCILQHFYIVGIFKYYHYYVYFSNHSFISNIVPIII